MLEQIVAKRHLIPSLVLFCFTTLLSCAPANKEKNETAESSTSDKGSPPAFVVENKEFSSPLSKASIDIRLEGQITESEVQAIARKIKQDFPGYDKYFIFYWLPGMHLGTGAWATSHFTPNLTVNMIGATAAEESKMKSKDLMPEGEVIGKWYDGRAGVEKTIVIYKTGTQYKYRDIYSDGSFGDQKLTKNLSKYTYPNSFGEYFKVEDDGNLGWYSKNGRFAIATKIE
jgi:hypothetical protein